MSDLSPYEKDQLRKKYGRNNISGAEMDIARKAKQNALNKKKESFSEKHAPYSKDQYSIAKDYRGKDIKVLKHNAKPKY